MQNFAARISLAAFAVLFVACASDDPASDDAGSDTGGRFDAGSDVGLDTTGRDIGGVDADSDTGSDAGDVTPDSTPDVEPGPDCGDGILDPGETCDDGDNNNDTQANACRTDCSLPTCGDAVVDSGEECDDGNLIDDDACSRACARTAEFLCEPCTANADCGGEGACAVLNDGNFCGITCRTNSECADGFICASVTDVDGAAGRQCVPSTGACTDCFDPDRDGYGAGAACTNGGDCDQSNRDTNPGATELCDGLDNDCDGSIDEGLDGGTYYADSDLDGFGDPSRAVTGCVKPSGFVDNADDCDDESRFVFPDAPELCDELDNDCDDNLDEDTADTNFWPDADGDGFGDSSASPVASCEPVDGATTNDDDCNDGNGLVSPSAPEACGDGVDNDCDGLIDCDDDACAGTPACAVTACVDDGLEENDDETQPAAIGAGRFVALVSCAGDVDFYAVNLAVGDTLSVSIDFTGADLDIFVTDSTLRIVDAGTSETDDEDVAYVADVAGPYFVIVEMYEGPDSGVNYDMDVAIEAAAVTCRDDGLEENDAASTASPIEAGTVDALTSCPGDSDFYAVNLAAGDELTASIDFAHADGDLSLALLSAAGTELIVADTATDDETLTFTVTDAGRYVLSVVLGTDAGEPGVAYTLDTSVTPTAAVCDTDAFEENDTLETPAALAPGTYDATVCRNDRDFYAVALGAGDTLTLELLFEDDDGDIDVVLYNPAGVQVAVSAGSTDEERIVYTAAAAGTYVIGTYVLFTDAGVPSEYIMDLEIERPAVECEDDFLEENDTRTTARFVAPGSVDDLRVCAGDDDYYYADLTSGDTINATLSFAHAGGNIDLRVLDPDGNAVASSTSVNDNETVSHVATRSGRYTLRASLLGETDSTLGNDYDLTFSVVEGADTCTTDRLERNDSQDGAETLAPELYTNLFVCDGNEDWYATEVPAGATMTVSLTFSHSDADVELAIVRPNGSRVTSITATDNEQASVVAVEGGVYYTRVYVVNGGTAQYALEIEVESATSDCSDDLYEDNDTQGTAYEASAVEDITSLVACPSDDDYFAFDLQVGDELIVLADFVDAEGDIDMVLRNPAGGLVSSAMGITDGELIEFTATSAGVHTLRVYLAADAGSTPGNDYSLSSEIVFAEAVCPTNDRLFGNQSEDTAEFVLTETLRGLNICSEDTSDFFEFYGFAGELVYVEIDFLHAEGDLDLYITSDGSGVDVSDGVTDGESVLFEVTESGLFVIEVYLAEDFGDAGVGYTLEVDAI